MATVITRVVVDKKMRHLVIQLNRLALLYRKEARRLMEETKAVFKEDAGRGWRRVVPSPKPVSIHEHKVINSLVEDGNIVIAVGGGGIPVIDSEEGLKGTEAVIDKDFAAQKLAELVDADTLVILTAVDHVYVNYNQPNQKLEHVTVNKLEEYIEQQQFAAKYASKIEAAINFVNTNPKRKTIITSLEKYMKH